MATGQTILDLMEVLDQELQLQSGESDVTRGLKALNAAQDFMESLFAQEADLFGDTTGTVTTSASTETTAYPTGLLRIDRLQLLDSNSRPIGDLIPIRRTGGHRANYRWPYYLFASSTISGKPVGYWTDGRSIYWDPLPDATHTVRWYGFKAADDITAGGTFGYPDICMLPLAGVAVRIMSVGLGDDTGDISSLAMQALGPVVQTLSNANRDGGRPLEYTELHTE